jgi:uncharacterized membrane protein YsdA (DUF1294 family)
MNVFRHKTAKLSFRLVVVAIVLGWVVLDVIAARLT